MMMEGTQGAQEAKGDSDLWIRSHATSVVRRDTMPTSAQRGIWHSLVAPFRIRGRYDFTIICVLGYRLISADY